MSISDLKEAFELIGRASDADFCGPKPETLVARAEQVLGVQLPPTYRRFPRRYGCGTLPGYEFYGAIRDDFVNSGVPDAIWTTLRYREETNLPGPLVLVYATGDGGYYAIDTSQKTAEGDNPVIEWWPGMEGAEGNGRIVASDFGAFLLEHVRWAIEDT